MDPGWPPDRRIGCFHRLSVGIIGHKTYLQYRLIRPNLPDGLIGPSFPGLKPGGCSYEQYRAAQCYSPAGANYNGAIRDWNAERGEPLPGECPPDDIRRLRSVTAAPARAVFAVVAATASVLLVASSATANGVTIPIAAGVSGPYEYQVGVGPFSPLRTALFVAVTLVVGGGPVTDADVTVTVYVDGSSTKVGPLDAANSLFHPATYEFSLDLPELPREKVSFRIGVESRQGPAVIEAEMIVPEVVETFDGDSAPAPAVPRRDREETSRGKLVYLGLALLIGGVGVGLGFWSIVGIRRRRTASRVRRTRPPD